LAPPPAKLPPPPPSVIKEMSALPQALVPFPSQFANETVRMVVRTTVGGRALRLQFSNAQGADPVRIGSTHVALRDAGAAIVDGSDHRVTFGGKAQIVIPPGAMIVSDPVPMAVSARRELAVSIYLPSQTATATVHALGLNPAYIAAGDATAAKALGDPKTVASYFWLSGVEVLPIVPGGVIVAFGDSITDGFSTTRGAHRAWPELLADRLDGDAATRGWGVVNMGISGNRVRRDGAGSSALARFDRDVLSRPGVKWIILLEGINDINITAMPGAPDEERTTAADLIDAYSQFVDKAHLHGIKVMGATVMPTEGLWLHSPVSEEMRQALNRWIRTSGKLDAVADFDLATRDPGRPARLRPEFDPGDHIHPNDAGNAAMAASIDLRAFSR
jgi:lysophospholipase L1-like esterase